MREQLQMKEAAARRAAASAEHSEHQGSCHQKEKALARRIRDELHRLLAPFTPSEIATRGAYSWLPENWQKFLHMTANSRANSPGSSAKILTGAFSRLDIDPHQQEPTHCVRPSRELTVHSLVAQQLPFA